MTCTDAGRNCLHVNGHGWWCTEKALARLGPKQRSAGWKTCAPEPTERCLLGHRSRTRCGVTSLHGATRAARRSYRSTTPARLPSFASTPADLTVPTGVWGRQRVVFAQHPSDPVVWWSPQLVWKRPDWLREPPGADVSPAMRWFPLVMFLQVAAGMAVSSDVPAGHGHHYRDFLAYWAAIIAPPGWTEKDIERLSTMIE